MRAAVRAGADAVYFGVRGFNARARATNFALESLPETMRFLHAHGVRGYVTLNTLVFEHQLAALSETIAACAEAGVDAVIVQDLGVVSLARSIAPSMAVHASTQMTCTDASAVELAASLGATRVILARETSIEEMAAIRRSTDVELEAFVHGALCIAYSGQCLTSEALGGRSANRGACAQACRLPYDLIVDGEVRDLGDRKHLLSPQDLETSEHVGALIDVGIVSLKIEGRLKGPEYVAAATRLYREAIDAALSGTRVSDRVRDDALQAYSRGSGPGFFGGVDHQRLVEGTSCEHRGLPIGRIERVERGRKTQLHIAIERELAAGDGIVIEGREIGGRVWEVDRGLVWLGPEVSVPNDVVGRRVFRTSSPSRAAAVRERTERDPYRVPLDLKLSGTIGAPFVLEGKSARGHVGSVVGDASVMEARTPFTRELAASALGRLGDTPFVLRELEIAIEGGTIPVSALNRARRRLVELCTNAKSRGVTPLAQPAPHAPARVSVASADVPLLFVLCRNEAQARAAIEAGADGVYLDFLELTGLGAALRNLRSKSEFIGVAPPRIRKPGEERIDRYLLGLAPDAILVRSLGALRERSISAGDGPIHIGDFSLNVTHRRTAEIVLGAGLAAFTPSFDLDAQQLLAFVRSDLAPHAEVVLHHPMPLFHMEHCVFAALLSSGSSFRDCGRPCERHVVSLRDRAGVVHPVEADVGCRNTVFHGAAQSAASLVPALREAGVSRYRIELVREDGGKVHELVHAYRALLRGERKPTDVWKTLRANDGYGVVRGSLRVLSSGEGGI